MLRPRLFVLFLVCLLASACGRGRYLSFKGYAQGGTYTVKVNVRGMHAKPAQMGAAIDSILRAVDFSLSGYNKASVLSRFNAGESVVPDELFLDLYERSCRFWEETGGALDIAAGPLFDAWGFGFTADSLPSAERLAQARARSGLSRCRRDIRQALGPDGRLRPSDLLREGETGPAPVLNFNAVAQGYSCDLVAAWLEERGARDYLVDIGEIRCAGLNQQGRGWSIGIDHPADGNDRPGAQLDGIWTSDGGRCGIVTSGNYRKYYIKDGKKYAHTLDPRSGLPVQHSLLSATVTAPDATQADALATACMVWGAETARSYIEAHAELEACLICADSIWTSPGFRKL
ncbi:MAG: FAD:protein FMN transferase [Bacteroidales bacterium]|nr:FAD:protein FMN transferase [Bacteroidales bacterium]